MNEHDFLDLLFGLTQLFALFVLLRFMWQTKSERAALILSAIFTLFYSVPVLAAQVGFIDPMSIKQIGFREIGLIFNPGVLYLGFSHLIRLYRCHVSKGGSENPTSRGKLGAADFLWIQALCSILMLILLDSLNVLALGQKSNFLDPTEVIMNLLMTHEAIFLGNAFLLAWMLFEAKRFPVRFGTALWFGVSLCIAIQVIHLLSIYYYPMYRSRALAWLLMGGFSIIWQRAGMILFRRRSIEAAQ